MQAKTPGVLRNRAKSGGGPCEKPRKGETGTSAPTGVTFGAGRDWWSRNTENCPVQYGSGEESSRRRFLKTNIISRKTCLETSAPRRV